MITYNFIWNETWRTAREEVQESNDSNSENSGEDNKICLQSSVMALKIRRKHLPFPGKGFLKTRTVRMRDRVIHGTLLSVLVMGSHFVCYPRSQFPLFQNQFVDHEQSSKTAEKSEMGKQLFSLFLTLWVTSRILIHSFVYS